uniref:Large ribosomal subunit protein uL3 n=1 Tax=Candidatus Kentrum eta TaxID=2126337 RepID=A0A450V4B5_9GAMM|nr:MAG: large subunit ribosomal protein L3 [Candidatus Kentron sp. H]VFJ99620.1 MAG: large subunit ribosomal protein L3 [Candidatus Kentron sp. H]VFK03895.1 MAG: large subunit ribosomal protein L3 [Candidatus Kentron sp. H]
MPIGVVGRKCGMMRVFTDEGASVPVTVIQVETNWVVQIKDKERDGYPAIQVTTGLRPNRITRAEAGHFAKAGVEVGRGLWEFPLRDGEGEDLIVGQGITLDIFHPGQKVDARGISIGKGYAGVVKRHNFRTQDASHGNSLSHRAPGSIGQNQTPGRVFKGKRMAGHMGNTQRTVQNLEVVRVDKVRQIILVKGAVPGPKGGNVILNAACKISRKESE